MAIKVEESGMMKRIKRLVKRRFIATPKLAIP